MGVLTDELNWLSLRTQGGRRASAILQKEVHELCKEAGFRVRDLKGVITCAGPGFYTGLRLSEGFADIFRIFSVPCYSFYSYEIPYWCGHTKGVWVTKAYRGEYFFHEWDGTSSHNTLVSGSDLQAYLEKFEQVFIHSPNAMDRELKNSILTIDLLKQKPEAILGEIIRTKAERESYYFRAPEDEFRVSV